MIVCYSHRYISFRWFNMVSVHEPSHVWFTKWYPAIHWRCCFRLGSDSRLQERQRRRNALDYSAAEAEVAGKPQCLE